MRAMPWRRVTVVWLLLIAVESVSGVLRELLLAPRLGALEAQQLGVCIDLLLAQKIAGSGARGRQAVTIEWDDVDQQTAWRYGLAMASAT